VRLVGIPQQTLEFVRARVIDIEIHKIDVLVILNFKPVNHGRQSLASRSPIGEKFNECVSARI
jgi:hypothetical protein